MRAAMKAILYCCAPTAFGATCPALREPIARRPAHRLWFSTANRSNRRKKGTEPGIPRQDTPKLPLARIDLGRRRLRRLAGYRCGGNGAVLRTEIVKRRSDGVKGFVVLPRRSVVERTFSWFGGNRRLAKDFEHLAATFVTLSPRSSSSSGDSPERRRGVRKGVVKGPLPEGSATARKRRYRPFA